MSAVSGCSPEARRRAVRGPASGAADPRPPSRWVEVRGALLEERVQPFLRLGSREAHHLERRRGVEGRPHRPEPVVERVLRHTDGGGRSAARRLAISSALSCSSSSSTHSDTRPYRSACSPLTGSHKEQQVLRLRHAAEQRPVDDRGVARRHAETRVPVDDLRGLPGDRDVGEEPCDEARADGRVR